MVSWSYLDSFGCSAYPLGVLIEFTTRWLEEPLMDRAKKNLEETHPKVFESHKKVFDSYGGHNPIGHMRFICHLHGNDVLNYEILTQIERLRLLRVVHLSLLLSTMFFTLTEFGWGN